jgi:ABC-type amino acid transport substrate-binding protein
VIVLSGDTPLLDGIKKLKEGEIDVMAETVAVFEWNVKSTGGNVDDFRKAFSHLGVAIYVAFANSPTGVKNAEHFDRGIKKLRESGGLEVILKKYGVHDWQ